MPSSQIKSIMISINRNEKYTAKYLSNSVSFLCFLQLSNKDYDGMKGIKVNLIGVNMFKHLLVPVDGSDVSKKSLKKVAELAKADKAAVTLVYVSDPMPPLVYSDSSMGYGISQKDHKKVCEAYAMDVFKKASLLLGASVKVSTLHIPNSNLSEGILDGAKKSKADVIVMASHKRTGIKSLLLGSETHEVIVHTKIPVLVLG
jgi:nucleotide-binding universal stress UspA family protein